MEQHHHDFDLFVIGSGPAGQRAAIQAAKLGKRVGLAERRATVGGMCINTGTIPSKTLREAVMHLTGYRHRGLYGASYQVKQRITLQDLLVRAGHVIASEIDITRHQLVRNGVELFSAGARFLGPNELRLTYADGQGERTLSADKIVIATGTSATRDAHIPFDGQHILTCEDILTMGELPKTLAVIGGGVIGCEYASIFAALGVRVTLIDKRSRLLPQVDGEIVDALVYHLRQSRLTLRLGEEVSHVRLMENDDRGERVKIDLGSGKHISVEKVLYSIGRTGNTGSLNVEAAGITADKRGFLTVGKDYLAAEGVYAVGDVIGFPSLAATSMEQGRLAACHAFGAKASSVPELFPYGIYAIPEISMVGRTEEELTAAGVPYDSGKAHYREIARGQIVGDETGMLKLLFHSETQALLGVHIIGSGATELVHIGQAAMALGGGVDYFVNTVFNYPTLAECYKTASLEVANRLAA